MGGSFDLINEGAAEAMIAGAVDSFGRVDILVNNAGIAHVGTAENTAEADFDRIYSVNVKGVYLCSQAGIRIMLREGGGVILNLASIASLIGLTDRFAYSMSKGAVVAMTRAMAVEMASSNVRVNSICPAAVLTFVTQQLIDSGVIEPAKLFDKYLIKRFATCEEIAELVAYLCSDAARYVTGANWDIDGGYCAK